jgi:capsular exopolysaccharide synthesis family protein
MHHPPTPSQGEFPAITFSATHGVAGAAAQDPALPIAARPGAPSATQRAAAGQPRLGLTPLKLWEAIWYRRWFALGLGLLLAAVGAALAWVTDSPRYTAVAMIRVLATEPRLLPGAEDSQARWNDEFRKTQVQLVRRYDTLKEVLKQDAIRGLELFRDKTDSIGWLEKELQVSYIRDTDIMRVAMTGENPVEIAQVVNAVKAQFLKEAQSESLDELRKRRDMVLAACADAEDRIKKQKSDLSTLASSLGTGDSQVLTLKQKIAIEEFSSMKRELASIDAELRKCDALFKVQSVVSKKLEGSEPSDNLVAEALDRDPVVQKLASDVVRLEAQVQEYGKNVQTTSPRLAEHKESLKVAQATLEQARAERRPKAVEKLKRAIDKQRNATLAETQEKIFTLQEQRQAVKKQVDALSNTADNIGKGSYDMERLRAEIEQADAVLKRLRAEKERLEMELPKGEAKMKRIWVIQDAQVPTFNQSTLLRTGGIYSTLGLLGGLLLVGLLESRSRRLHKPSDVQGDLGIHTLGVLPLLAGSASSQADGNNTDTQPIVAADEAGLLRESVDSLRNTLLCDDHLHARPVIMVTSGSEEEGKTFLSRQLAFSLARTGRKALFLDCDLKKPTAHRDFNLPDGPGLCEVLRGEAELAQAVRTLPESDLSVLPVGQMDDRAVQALSNGRFRELIGRLREEFDCVVLDSSPTLVVSDTLLVGKQVDGVILVVRPTVSRSPLVYSAFQQMRGLRIPILGAVINGVPFRSRSGYYKSRYHAS